MLSSWKKKKRKQCFLKSKNDKVPLEIENKTWISLKNWQKK